ncbi:hypothetical protein MAH1_03660 [Sessilibacter sp. MAH1]
MKLDVNNLFIKWDFEKKFLMKTRIGKLNSTLLAVFLASGGNTSLASEIYEPEGKEQFVIYSDREFTKEYGFDGFCTKASIKKCSKKLPYEQYSEAKGYFSSQSPTTTDKFGNKFHLVVLENGQNYYFLESASKRDKYSLSSIIPMERYVDIKAFKPEPLVKGSKIMLIAVEIQSGYEVYVLSDGNRLVQEHLNKIRHTYELFGENTELADLLVKTSIRERKSGTYSIEADESLFFKTSEDGISAEKYRPSYGGIDLSLSVLGKNYVPRLKVGYGGDNDLLVKSFEIIAGDQSWHSPDLLFLRSKPKRGLIWDETLINYQDYYLKINPLITQFDKVIIRFHGEDGYKDYDVPQVQLEAYKHMLSILDELPPSVNIKDALLEKLKK